MPRDFQTLVRQVFLGGNHPRLKGSLWAAAQAGAVREDLWQRDLLPRGVHVLHRVSKDLAQRGGPVQPAFLDEHRDECRGHGLGAGTKVKSIVERDAFRGPSLSDSCDALGDDAIAPQNDSGHAESFGPQAEDRMQY